MELQELLDEMENTIITSTDPADAFRNLCSMCNQIRPHAVWKQLSSLDVQEDLDSLEEWAKDLFSENPPDSSIKAIWFGIFDAYDEEGSSVTVLYASGTDKFDPDDEDFDWTVDPAWLPEDRYAESSILAELAARAEELAMEDDEDSGDEEEDADEWEDEESDEWSEEDDEEDEEDDELSDEEMEGEELEVPDFDTLISYFMTLGYGALVVGHLCRRLGPKVMLTGGAQTRPVCVGFDEGDGIILGEMRQDGWHQIDLER